MPATRRLVILGATGTVGVQALEILASSASPLEVVALSAHSRATELAAAGPAKAQRFLTSDSDQDSDLLRFLREGAYEICLNAVVGAAGLPYTEAALSAGCDVALANKESLVLAGGLLTELAAQQGANIVPVDSEHSAIHQCLPGGKPKDIRQIFLTASGGALRDLPSSKLAAVTPAQALAHPNWDMGPRITIDSATMMNKAFEVIEARWLFDLADHEIKVLIHRQSIVHSMVEFIDGSMLAQLGPPDMSFPIHYALHFPQRKASPLQGFDPVLFSNLTFEEPDLEHYPALALGWRAAKLGGDAGAVLNAADEIAVEAFLQERISFPDITRLCAAALESCCKGFVADIADVLEADARSRAFVTAEISNLSHS
ncbi:MAG: 1-deoxy-D-xylulose-5-phosphate reductoisomerase [Planctomycetes bacterium]|nr:1-deoxy-D-xylulose-5-phosphate reductoisomerase [Planctomycetota bacterium]MCP4770806.1 1-deoxy-D-xylulose-5-phosphate reductoisomerase [Planctomycetota bacterium]MCP4861346.1 1-deoxy-D-xylulose-5-phosphate reductoisomerase [Planctomycetota bacterium]